MPFFEKVARVKIKAVERGTKRDRGCLQRRTHSRLFFSGVCVFGCVGFVSSLRPPTLLPFFNTREKRGSIYILRLVRVEVRVHLFSRTSCVQSRQGRKCARRASQIVLRARRHLVPLLLQAGTGRKMQRVVGEHTFTRESRHG